MSAQLRNLYGLYSELESLPEQAAQMEFAANQKRQNLASQSAKIQRQIVDKHSTSCTSVHARDHHAHDDLEQKLSAAAQSATSKGALPNSSAKPSGRAPDFARFKEEDDRLSSALNDKHKLEEQLRRLQDQLARESGMDKARRNDIVSYALLAIAAVASVLIGTNISGAIIGIALATTAQIVMSRGPSAFVLGHAKQRPYVVHDKRIQSGIAQVLVGWCLLGIFVLTSVLHERNNLLYWIACAYPIVLLIRGYKRRGGQ